MLKTEIKNKENRLVVERLTALWALNECGLGGFMHAFSSPFTGIVVGGISILLISLIALHSKKVFPTLLKALSIVLLIKLSVSPHSPITAYVAVSFQAFLGILLYSIFSVNRITIIFLGVITFSESALQKLLTLTIIYGQSLWDAIDVYTKWVSNELTFINLALSSKTLILIFVGFYAFAGLLVGFLIVKIIKLMESVELSKKTTSVLAINKPTLNKKSHFLPKKLVLFWAITAIVIIIPLLFFSNELNSWKTGIYLLARSFLILVLWYVILGPLLLKGLNKLLSKKQTAYQSDIQNTLSLFPHLKSIIHLAWKDSNSLNGLNRMQHFLAKSIVYSVHFNPPKNDLHLNRRHRNSEE